MIGLDEKCHITAVLCGTLKGNVLPLQFMYTSKTTACLLKVSFPQDWLISFTPNHWTNKVKTKEYLNNPTIHTRK